MVVVVIWPLWLAFRVREGVVGSHFDFQARENDAASRFQRERADSGAEKSSKLDLRDDDWDMSRNRGGKCTLALVWLAWRAGLGHRLYFTSASRSEVHLLWQMMW